MRFSEGEAPGKVLLKGLGMLLLWGGIAFVVLPILVPILFDFGQSAFDISGEDQRIWLLVAPFIAVIGFWAVFLTLRLIDGLVRTYRGLMDLREPVVVEGEVVRVHRGRAARS